MLVRRERNSEHFQLIVMIYRLRELPLIYLSQITVSQPTRTSLYNLKTDSQPVNNTHVANGKPPTPITSASSSAADNGNVKANHDVRNIGHLVDKWSRVVFPVAFVLFNVGYWVYYTQSAQLTKTN